MSIEAKCMSCGKTFVLDTSDPQYMKLKTKASKQYTCKKCNKVLQEEASNFTGIRPEMLDPKGYDKRVP